MKSHPGNFRNEKDSFSFGKDHSFVHSTNLPQVPSVCSPGSGLALVGVLVPSIQTHETPFITLCYAGTGADSYTEGDTC